MTEEEIRDVLFEIAEKYNVLLIYQGHEKEYHLKSMDYISLNLFNLYFKINEDDIDITIKGHAGHSITGAKLDKIETAYLFNRMKSLVEIIDDWVDFLNRLDVIVISSKIL